MSNVISAEVKKFTKWLIVRKEIKFKQCLDMLDRTQDDYNRSLVELNKQNDAWLDKIHNRHQLTNLMLTIVASISAISSLIVALGKLF